MLHFRACPNEVLAQAHHTERFGCGVKSPRAQLFNAGGHEAAVRLGCALCLHGQILRQLMVAQNALMIFICIKLFSPLSNIMDK